MKGRILLLSAILSHAALGNVCMMQLAYAAEASPAMHDMAGMHMADDESTEHDMPCAGGHCIVEALPQAAAAVPVATPIVLAGILPAAAYAIPATDPLPYLPAAAPPGTPIQTRTVILRC